MLRIFMCCWSRRRCSISQRLCELLGHGVELPPGPCVWIAPRMGTQSPWSSKATDILHNTGFENIARIERARVVRIAGAQRCEGAGAARCTTA